MYRLAKNGVKFTLIRVRLKVPKVDKHTFFTITHLENEMKDAIKESMVIYALVVK